MRTSIDVMKQSVLDFLKEGKNHPFVIPEYQRPYAWTDDQIITLFTDLWEFATTLGGADTPKATYFLGSTVGYINEKEEREIIDGQQRITSLFLLIRAIYTKLSATPEENRNQSVMHYLREIGPALWRTSPHDGVVDYTSTHLHSQVINEDGNVVLHKILETGVADANAVDKYSKNYILFQRLLDKYVTESPMALYDFIYAILNQAIILPITADTQDTALTIFSTLNDRGLPLSDADIFKAKLYNRLSEEEKKEFIEQWQTLEQEASEVGESMQSLFYYHMFYLRAVEKNVDSTIPGLRKYYSQNKFSRLFIPGLMDNLATILSFWKMVHELTSDVETLAKNIDLAKTLDILVNYPNEFWKYPSIIYYMCHHEEADFSKNFNIFLRKLLMELLTRYFVNPTVNGVKPDVVRLNVNIIHSNIPEFEFKKTPQEALEPLMIRVKQKKMLRLLLSMLAYEKQDKLLPRSWQIEHILPQKFEGAYTPKHSIEAMKEYVDHIGNKIPFEKKYNIKASNDFFTRKKAVYVQSSIAITKELGDSIVDTWTEESIIKRDAKIYETICQILTSCDETYRTHREEMLNQ